MRNYFVLILVIFALSVSAAEEHGNCMAHRMLGKWEGTIKVQGTELRIVFNISEVSCGNFRATMDSPDQNAYDIPVDEVIINGNILELKMPSINGNYQGKLKEQGIIEGKWKQAGNVLELNLVKSTSSEDKRPQEPCKPYPYYTEEVIILNNYEGITLSGTLTLPERGGPFPAVILISGSGPQNRNEEVFGHKPFLVIADYLTRNGISVLRFDERGVGESEGEYESATSKDFAEDVEAAVDFLIEREEINVNKIGLLGHSEGAYISSMLAARRTDDIAFIILLGGTVLPGDEILKKQTELIAKAEGINESITRGSIEVNEKIYSIIKSEEDREKARKEIRELIQKAYKEIYNSDISEENLYNQVKQAMSPWLKFFITYDPRIDLKKVECPVLALFGEKDLQVSSKENIKALKEVFKESGLKDYKIMELPGLNHLFQEAETGSPNEYAEIEQTIAPVTLETIAGWIKRR